MKLEEKTEFISLNSELPSFFVEELEQRLETDPLAVGGLLDTSSGDGIQPRCGFEICSEADCFIDIL